MCVRSLTLLALDVGERRLCVLPSWGWVGGGGKRILVLAILHHGLSYNHMVNSYAGIGRYIDQKYCSTIV